MRYKHCAVCSKNFEARGSQTTCGASCSAEQKRQRDQRPRGGHHYRDLTPLAAPDWKPRTVRKDPEAAWAKAMGGRTYAAAPIASGDPIADLASVMVGAER